MPTPPSPEAPDLEPRVRRLEEAIGFTEHTTDQLTGEVASAHEALARLHARLAALEARLMAVEAGPEEVDDDDNDDAPA